MRAKAAMDRERCYFAGVSDRLYAFLARFSLSPVGHPQSLWPRFLSVAVAVAVD